MKKFYLALGLILALSTFFSFGVLASTYTPSPGVLNPDQVDFGGATVTFIGWVTEKDFDYGTIREGRLEEAMAAFNIGGFEFIQRPGAEFIMTRIMTGDAINDIIHEDWRTQYYAMAGHGMLHNLNDFLPQEYYDNLIQTDKTIHKDVLSIGNDIYTFGNIYGMTWAPTAMVYNQSMLEREGLPDIYDLWTSGNWTWEEAEKLIEAVTRDRDGDGAIDQWGIAWRRLGYAVHINNAQFVKKDDAGNYRYGYADEESIWVFDKIAEWYTDGYIVPKNLDGSNRIGNGTVLMQFGSNNPEGGIAQNGDILVAAPLPKGPHTDRHIYPEWAVQFGAIPITADNPQALIAVHDFLFRQEDLDFNTWFRNEVAARFPNQKSAEHLMYAIENWGGDMDWFNGFDGLPDISLHWGSDLEPLLMGIESPRSKLDAYRPVAQSEIDQLFRQ